jgi:two-component system CheB/CheR fusion protein
VASNNLQNLINSVDIGTIFLDRSFRVVLFTPPARTLFNLIANDIGRPLSDITNKLEYPDIIADAELVLERLHIVEREIKARDGQIFTMRLLPYRTEEDRIDGVVITFFNVTERRRSELSLRESEERFRAIIGQTTAGIVQAELTGRFTLANKKFCDILGYTEAELLEKTLLDVTYKDDQKQSRELFERLRAKGTPFNIEKRLVCKDMSLRWVNVSVSAIRSPEGSPEMAVAVYQDVTERKALEQQKDEFVAIASHELKTPVTSIKAYTEVLQEKFELLKEPRHAALMQKLNGQVDRLTLLIRDLLDTTKMTEGKLALHFEKIAVNELIDQRIEELQRLSEKHEIVFNKGRIKTVMADRERIGQVMTNLISNAIKYSPAGGKITVTTEAAETGVRVTVLDKGIGIDDAHKNLVFDRFFRVNDPRVKTSQGMGLGLYISAVIVQRHQGAIGLTSILGKGSSFHFTLPYVQKKSKA